ncbi:hypothetical protein A1Q1_06834 [Trichosporon asahii var. asahii CBS 2479]|uniref:Uncharacterized protein n=1 Tax=Trichosporon asahii var. asahii (strain ATCC 90039 / CBS 2479 / JCM 2466 / KCTC 7840 / NBRC 103889/ NCYC 2677 / UAMH 7654) TaxID=1186058 RepID=J5TP43_TRIAS|nr:hypothetical protein A1Q1_06834 [Trichosporon asahii var. asahii CBS 2479]EJT51911.1 hypothetical protein A1Q1_06834 [Trichosporon asahii var. asahii CBS 2479]
MRSETEKQASSSKLQVRGPGHQAPGFELRSLSAGLRWRRMLTVTRSDETSKRVELIPRFHCWLRIVLGSQVDHTGVDISKCPRLTDHAAIMVEPKMACKRGLLANYKHSASHPFSDAGNDCTESRGYLTVSTFLVKLRQVQTQAPSMPNEHTARALLCKQSPAHLIAPARLQGAAHGER